MLLLDATNKKSESKGSTADRSPCDFFKKSIQAGPELQYIYVHFFYIFDCLAGKLFLIKVEIIVKEVTIYDHVLEV